MKRCIILVICFFSFLAPIQAQSYCVMNGDDGSIVEEENMHTKQSVASISKVMTAIVAIEDESIHTTWKLSSEVLKAHGSSIYIKPGQRVTLETLLYGLLLRSGNDAAKAISEHISGSEVAFVKKMNKKAKQLGMKDTCFHNASGLDDDSIGNISSAYDMALLMNYAMKNKTFRKIVGTKYYNHNKYGRWKNKNKLLFDFPFTTGGKTGYTKKAGRTLISTAKNQAIETIVVSLQVPDDFAFHKQKHVEAMSQLKVYPIIKKGTYHAGNYEVHVLEDVNCVMKPSMRNKLVVKAYFKNNELIVRVKNQIHERTYRWHTIKQVTSF